MSAGTLKDTLSTSPDLEEIKPAVAKKSIFTPSNVEVSSLLEPSSASSIRIRVVVARVFNVVPKAVHWYHQPPASVGAVVPEANSPWAVWAIPLGIPPNRLRNPPVPVE